MPIAPRAACSHSTCRYRKPCPVHKTRRPSARQMGYDRAHEALRAHVLREEPICRLCHRAPSVIADHIVSIKARPELRLVRSNVRGVCTRCHNRRTAQDQPGGWNLR
jgi:5-methylcytosine-specific restriction protein A